MEKLSVIFLGSFQEYSAQVLAALLQDSLITLTMVVTTPPHPQGRKKILTPNPVQHLAEQHDLRVFTPESLDDAALSELQTLGKPDFLVTAGYGKLLPESWLSWPKLAALNVHFSLLPKFRGANPAEWAILMNETATGVSIIEMSPAFDTGKIVSQATSPLDPQDTRDTVYHRLYHLGGKLLLPTLHQYASWKKGQSTQEKIDLFQFYFPALTQEESSTPYAKRLQRQDGYLPWKNIVAAMKGLNSPKESLSNTLQLICPPEITPAFIERMSRALLGFPTLWTEIPTPKGPKRMKIVTTRLQNNHLVLEQVQIEGQQISLWNQVKNQVI